MLLQSVVLLFAGFFRLRLLGRPQLPVVCSKLERFLQACRQSKTDLVWLACQCRQDRVILFGGVTVLSKSWRRNLSASEHQCSASTLRAHRSCELHVQLVTFLLFVGTHCFLHRLCSLLCLRIPGIILAAAGIIRGQQLSTMNRQQACHDKQLFPICF